MIRRSFVYPLLLALTAACGGPPAAPDDPSTGPRPGGVGGGDVVAGEAAFASLGCKGCHGSRAEPGGVGPNLFTIAWSPAEEAEARETILKGRPDHKPPMPGYEGEVDATKMADLLAFLRGK